MEGGIIYSQAISYKVLLQGELRTETFNAGLASRDQISSSWENSALSPSMLVSSRETRFPPSRDSDDLFLPHVTMNCDCHIGAE